MKTRRTVLHVASVAIAMLLSVSTASASVFPDVPAGHMFQLPIEQLVASGVINGNPDGTFDPDRAVNRAEMLKMLYKAKGFTPDPGAVFCFPDVEPGSWYESYICDAVQQRFVNGYSDGTFHPGQSVNRVEALKMIQTVFGFTIDNLSDEDRDTVNFVDVSTSAWYTKYLFNAYKLSILPIPGQSGSHFFPDADLKRGEAAAMIYNALHAKIKEEREETEKQLLEEMDKEDASEPEEEAEPEKETMRKVSFPFTESAKFDEKKPFSFEFSLQGNKPVYTEVEMGLNQSGRVRCTLFLFDEDGTSYEFYIGSQWGRKCMLLTTLKPGKYQLQIQPTDPNVTFEASSSITEEYLEGDDGFDDAKTLTARNEALYTMGHHNYNDWYKFTINEGDPDNLQRTIEFTNTENLDCSIYPMKDVDLYGFSGPQCNEPYTYPPGTYYVGIIRSSSPTASLNYTVRILETFEQ